MQKNLNNLGFNQESDDHHHPSLLDFLQEKSADDSLYEQVELLMTEAQDARREALEERLRRGKAEKEAFNAIRKAKVSESKYGDGFKSFTQKQSEFEEALARGRENLNIVRNQRDQVMEQLRIAQSKISSLENNKKERDEIQKQRDDAVAEVEELRQVRQGFVLSEVLEATRNFDPTMKVAAHGEIGSVYKVLLRYTEVLVKVISPNGGQGDVKFKQEVDALINKVRHPNLITLMGNCPASRILIYEYLPNGSLEERLNCKDNSPPLPWHTRIRIATQLCSVVAFLHSSKPQIIHGGLKPANILLDANYTCKLCPQQLLSCGETRRIMHIYKDPDSSGQPGKITTKSDVYSFGIILLQLLIGRLESNIAKQVGDALNGGNLQSVIDPLAGDWPLAEAKKFAHLALWCCDRCQGNRPDLGYDVWRELKLIRVSSDQEPFQPPPYFVCPISQEVMENPHIAEDGFTYEAKELEKWFNTGHNTSPMTNLKIKNRNLVPNRALHSAIRDWNQHK